jgi:SPP1 family predicted phage head-tail adaptor
MNRVSDGQGGFEETWVDVIEVWAKIKPSSGKERYFANRIEPDTTHKIVIRWASGLNESMRILFEGRIFQIKSIDREDERRFFMYIDAEENVAS